MPVCKLPEDKYLCPHCLLYNNLEECELFNSSCRESEIQRNQYSDYCDKKYGQWRTKFIAANYSMCQCCDECVLYREIGESCVHSSNYNMYMSETLPVMIEDLRAGCNPYREHPSQASKALECDEKSGTCVLMNSLDTKRFELTYTNPDYELPTEGTCMLDAKCGLPHKIRAVEPCKVEMMKFKKQFEADAQLHLNAPQCTPLWKYAPVQCRGMLCYCALQDGTPITGFDVPRADVSNMDCACAREKCQNKNTLFECDGYGNYKKFCFVYLDEGHPPPQGNHVPLLTIEKLEDEIVYTSGVSFGLAHHTYKVMKTMENYKNSSSTKSDVANIFTPKTGRRFNTTEASSSEFSSDEITTPEFSTLHFQTKSNPVLISQMKFFFDDDEQL